MREIKFRAWDKKENKWFENQYKWYGFTIIGECTMFDMPAINRLQDMVFMQYTGLKDRTGRDLFEGDIIKIIHTGIFIAEWYQEFAGFIAKPPPYKSQYYSVRKLGKYAKSCEVIGNIYENPELLKGDSK